MTFQVSVIIPTHNPHQSRLDRTLQALIQQSLPLDRWELIVVDNATPNLNYVSSFDISWHPDARIVREDSIGLTKARLAGIRESKGTYLVFVDDDNILHLDYLKNALDIFRQFPRVGAIGGKSLPEFELEPEDWLKSFWSCLALRDFGNEAQIYAHIEGDKQYPSYAPIGAGMSIRREAAHHYYKNIEFNSSRLSFDRTGKSLQSGGDCDINLTLLEAGWAVGYFPELSLTHLISAERLTKHYLARLNHASSRSWVQVLHAHGICPWQRISKWGVLPRKAKALFAYQPWKSSEAFVRWQGACGLFEGLATL